jgi:CS domain
VQLELGHSPLARYHQLQYKDSVPPLDPTNVPRLLHASLSCPAAPPQLRPITKYSWQDHPSHVELKIPLPYPAFPAEVECSFTSNSLTLHVRGHPSLGLTLRSLFGEIDAERCVWSLSRPPAAGHTGARNMLPSVTCTAMGHTGPRSTLPPGKCTAAGQTWPPSTLPPGTSTDVLSASDITCSEKPGEFLAQHIL